MRTIFYSIICAFCFQTSIAQHNEYLYQVGNKDSLYSKVLNEYRTIYIQIPNDYTSESKKKYPVAYILDGELLLPALSNVLDFYSGGFMPEMVLVGISNAKNRTRDLTSSKITEKYGMPFNQQNGEGDNFLKFIHEELIPFVESKYPVTNYRTLIGHSYGGLFAINVLMHQPKLFVNYLSIDPSLDWDNQKLLKQAETVLSQNDFKGKALYMSLSGQLHMQDSNITIDNIMQDTTDFTIFPRSNIMFSNLVNKNKQNGLDFKWQFYPNDLHGTIPLPSIKDGLLSLFEWYQMENTDKINSFDTSKEELLEIVKHRETKLKNHFGYSEPPYPEALLNMSGYMNMDMQQLEKAKMYFELAIAYYPKSANAYDSMADYYKSQNDNTKALRYATKAFQIDDSDYFKSKMESLKVKK